MECRSLEDELYSAEFASYLVVSVVALMIIVYSMLPIIGNFMVFAKDTELPGEKSFILGTIFSFIILSYVTYHSGHYFKLTSIILLYLLFLTLYVIWCLNLSVAAEYHVKGAKPHTNASFYLVSCLIVLLILFYRASCYASGVAMLTLVPIGWCTYTLYRWWFRYHPKRK